MQAKSLLYARRAKGDLDLSLEPARIGADGKRRWAEIITPGGRLPGRPEQDIYTYNATPNYRIGTRRVMDERVFRYARVGSCDGDPGAWEHGVGVNIEYGSLVTSAVYPTPTATVVSGAATSSTPVVTFAVDLEEDELEGGYFGISSFALWGCKILGNSEGDAGAEITIELETPLPVAITALPVWAEVTVIPSPYSNVIRPAGTNPQNWDTAVGFPLIYTGADGIDIHDQYIWIQTWGPVACPSMNELGGAALRARTIFLGGTGTPSPASGDDRQQAIGWWLPPSPGTLPAPDDFPWTRCFIWLTLAP